MRRLPTYGPELWSDYPPHRGENDLDPQAGARSVPSNLPTPSLAHHAHRTPVVGVVVNGFGLGAGEGGEPLPEVGCVSGRRFFSWLDGGFLTYGQEP